MSKLYPALVLYSFASFLFIISVVFDLETLSMLFKPMIAPAIYFYYWQKSNGKVSVIFSLILFLFYCGDMMILIQYENLFVPLMLMNLVAYLLLFKFLVEDLMLLRENRIHSSNIFSIIIFTLFLLSLLYMGLKLIFDASSENYGLITFYGITLFLLGLQTTFLYIMNNSSSNVFLAITTLCFIMSDLFYVLYNYYLNLDIFIFINVSCQVISFYFLVNYILNRGTISKLNINK
ncbi:hypothetical protein ABGT15_05670 [Flavobacterium enshiense]|uniref:hypothetical protein n=1 Tax=Flavobacterium enshiense TaxID=1341165 RepID=UPI00345D5E14